MKYAPLLLLAFLLTLTAVPASAQYFGQNKPRYQRFDFRVYESDNFTFYTYLNDRQKINQLADWAEQWHDLHQAVLLDTFLQRNPILWYNHHAHFQQTNAIMGPIGQGTGGVTEGFKNRVIHPILMTNKATHHVLGHELVHAFQYNMVIHGENTDLRNMGNMPLWLVEGMAEYMSIGRLDAHTSLWMRDAYLHDRIPTLMELDNPRFFPYRYGQAFWSFLTGMYGDRVIRPFFLAAAQAGVAEACKAVLGMELQTLSDLWVNTLKNHYAAQVPVKADNTIGKPLLTDKNAGEMNLAPVVSPDGRYVLFVSEKELFSLDMYLADARTGKILRKVASTFKEGHVDDFNTIESSATWSPKSDQFAFVATRRGRNVIIVKDADNGRTDRTIEIDGVEAINYPAWSPDGRSIAFSGMVEGESDIYVYELRRGQLRKLTEGPESEIMPAWSADGAEIVFSTDYLDARRGGFPTRWGFNIGVVDVISGVRTDLDLFPGAENMNPQFDGNGDILFLSNRDGFRNIYRYDRARDELVQLSQLRTGITGITQYSPALTVSFKRDRLLFSHFTQGRYSVHSVNIGELNPVPVDRRDVRMDAALLPIPGKEVTDLINTAMAEANRLGAEQVLLLEVPYRSRFRLDYLGGGGGMGVGVGNNTLGTGTAMMGGVDALFSDVLGNNLLFMTLMMNGELADIGGQFQYLNQKHAIGWGVRMLHIPFRSGRSYYAGLDSVIWQGQPILADKVNTDLQRIFRSQAGLFAQYPFSPFQRVEVSGNFIRFGFRTDRYSDFYSGNFFLGRNRERLPSPPGFNLYTTGTAWVGDRSTWGFTSPLMGYRFRVGADQYLGQFQFLESLLDGRRYFRMRPFTLALRGYYLGRDGKDAGFQPMYVGDPMLVRGFTGKTFDRLGEYGIGIEQMIGSRLLVSNIEIRLPFTGPRRLALIPSSFLLTDLNIFLDGGIAFSDFDQLRWNLESNARPRPVFSAGTSLRINLFGALILEPYYAWPLVKGSRVAFGLNFIPGF